MNPNCMETARSGIKPGTFGVLGEHSPSTQSFGFDVWPCSPSISNFFLLPCLLIYFIALNIFLESSLIFSINSSWAFSFSVSFCCNSAKRCMTPFHYHHQVQTTRFPWYVRSNYSEVFLDRCIQLLARFTPNCAVSISSFAHCRWSKSWSRYTSTFTNW